LKIGVNEINFTKESMNLENNRFTVGMDIVFGNVLDKNDIQWIMKNLKDKLTLDNLIEVLKK